MKNLTNQVNIDIGIIIKVFYEPNFHVVFVLQFDLARSKLKALSDEMDILMKDRVKVDKPNGKVEEISTTLSANAN